MEVAGYDDRSTGYSLALYETRGQEEPLFCDDFYVRNIGDVRFKIPPTAKGKEMRDSAGVVYTTCECSGRYIQKVTDSRL